MTVKVLLLKSGEDIIADVQEMISSEEQVMGYLLTKPCAIKIRTKSKEDGQKTPETHVQMFPWMSLAKEKVIPITADWVVTIVTPVDKIKEMYETDVLTTYGGEEDDQVTNLDNKRKVGLTD